MKKIIFCLFVLCGHFAFSQNGIVTIETKYQDVAYPDFSMKYDGQGFIVDYPVKSKITNKTVNLKIVLTAAHLVFGGIYTERMDNFRIFESETKKEIYALGMISDVIHDSAVIVLCTKDAIALFEEEYKAYGLDLNQLQSPSGVSFKDGAGCAYSGQAEVLEDVASFASYKGPELVFDTGLGQDFDHTGIAQGSLSKSKIVVNETQSLAFLKAGDSYAVPWAKEVSTAPQKLYQAQDLKTNLNSSINDYLSLSEVPGEYSIPLSLEGGYSGSPITTYDTASGQLIVEGIYKSSTQSLNADAYAGFGWASPTEISQGLLTVFLVRYPQQLHRWHTIPQVYLYLNDGALVRELYYSDFILRENESAVGGANPLQPMVPNVEEGVSPVVPPIVPDQTKAVGWVRSDTGKTLWIRSDAGKVYSSTPKKAKTLRMTYRSDLEAKEVPMLLIAIKNEKDEPYIILPPVMESVIFVSKNVCPSCVNFKVNDLESVSVLDDQSPETFIKTLWGQLNTTTKNIVDGKITKRFFNANIKSDVEGDLKSQAKTKYDQIEAQYSLEGDRLKVNLIFNSEVSSANSTKSTKTEQDIEKESVTIYILSNNKYSYLGFDGTWIESEFASVLETKTKLGRYVWLELAGILYYNLELHNPYSFRMKIEDEETQLFEVKSERP